MKLDILQKARKLAEHVPGFAGYGAADYQETDRLLRRHLACEIEKVRDRLEDLIADGKFGEKGADSLRTTTYLHDEVMAAENGEPGLSASDEERLLDFDLVLLEKVAALHTPLDDLETARGPEAEAEAFDLFDEGLAEADDLFRLRHRVLLGEGGGR